MIREGTNWLTQKMLFKDSFSEMKSLKQIWENWILCLLCNCLNVTNISDMTVGAFLSDNVVLLRWDVFFIHCCLLLFSAYILCGLSSVSSLGYCSRKKQAGLLFKQKLSEWCQRMQSNLNRIVGGDNTRVIPGLWRKSQKEMCCISVPLYKGCPWLVKRLFYYSDVNLT